MENENEVAVKTEQELYAELTSYEKFQMNMKKAKESVHNITNKALDNKILIEDMDLELEELVIELKGKETELFGTQKEIQEEVLVEAEQEIQQEIQHETKLDENPHSPTYGQQIPIG